MFRPILMICSQKPVILSETKWSRRILAEQEDRSVWFCFAAMPRSFDSALSRSAQDDIFFNAQQIITKQKRAPQSAFFVWVVILAARCRSAG